MADPQPQPIEIIQTIVPKQKDFVAFSDEDNTQSLADNLPDGVLWRAKNIQGTNFRKFLIGLALEIGRVEDIIEFIADDYYIWTSTKTGLLSDWERTVGIPDSCFEVKDYTPLETRVKNVIAKFALMNIITRDEFKLLAEFFGFEVEITDGFAEPNGNAFPLTFPIIFSETPQEARFTMIVKFLDVDVINVFPFEFPIVFDDDPTTFLRCIFLKLKPAYCRMVFLPVQNGTEILLWVDDDGNVFNSDDYEEFYSPPL